MNKNLLIMVAVALVAVSSGYFLARAISPADNGNQEWVGLPESGGSQVPVTEGLLGQMRPDFTLHDTAGEVVSASDFDGHAWLVNFWATWCEPCVEEMPMLSEVQRDFADKGVKVVGIALDDAERAREFAANIGVEYPILVGKTDVVLAGRKFGNSTGALPFSVLVDDQGVIRWVRLGALKREELEKELLKIH